MPYTLHGRVLDAFTRAYLVCLFWSENDEAGESYETRDDEDLAPEAVDTVIAQCADFQTAQAADLAAWPSPEDAGYNFCLTRNGHGTGFWDRGQGTLGDRLSAACKPYGPMNLYEGDDGRLYVS